MTKQEADLIYRQLRSLSFGVKGTVWQVVFLPDVEAILAVAVKDNDGA